MIVNMIDVRSDSSIMTQSSHVPIHLQWFLCESYFLILQLTAVIFYNYNTDFVVVQSLLGLIVSNGKPQAQLEQQY